MNGKHPLKQLLVVLLMLAVGSAVAYAQPGSNDCAQELADAEQHYRTGNFDDAIITLVLCVSKPDLTDEQMLKAYRLLGLAYLAKDYEKDAYDAIDKLLDLVPDYQPDPVQDPPPFAELVERIRKERQAAGGVRPEEQPAPDFEPVVEEKEGGGKKTWLIIGGAGLAAAGVAVLFLGGDGGNGATFLDEPPDLPGN